MQEPPVCGTEGTNAGPGEFKPGDPLSSLWSVTRRVLLSPRRFFDALPPEAPAGAALLYFLVCYLIAVAMIAILAVLGVAAWFVLGAFTAFENPALPFGLLVLAGMALLVLSVLGPAIFFAGVLIQHAIVVLVARRAQRGLRATARALCYAAGATLLLAWIPFVGVVAALYGCYLYQTGLPRVHGLSPTRSGVAFSTLAIPTLALTVVLASVAYNANRSRGVPRLTTFPLPRPRESFPPGTVGAAALMDGNEDQARVRGGAGGLLRGRSSPGPVSHGGQHHHRRSRSRPQRGTRLRERGGREGRADRSGGSDGGSERHGRHPLLHGGG